jgi:hypothetical protein
MLYGIPAAELPAVWPHVVRDIEEAANSSRGKYTADDMRGEIERGDCQLWIWHTETARAVVVTQIHSYRRLKCCWVRIATGHNYRECAAQVMQRIEAWAKENGCDAMELIARPGWSRVLDGYDMTHVYLEKRL